MKTLFGAIGAALEIWKDKSYRENEISKMLLIHVGAIVFSLFGLLFSLITLIVVLARQGLL